MKHKYSIHQVLPGFNTKDAICNEALIIRDFYRSRGFSSEIYVDVLLNNHAEEFGLKKFSRFFPGSKDKILYHFSVYDRVAGKIPSKKGTWILRYHNITPADFFFRWDPSMSGMLEGGRNLLPGIVKSCRCYIADSEYNKKELQHHGAQSCSVLPLIFPLDTPQEDDRVWTEKLNDGKKNIIFVGRIAPNKRQDDLIRVFAWYREFFEPAARLILPGSFNSYESGYSSSLFHLIRALKLDDSVFLPGKISQEQLVSVYKTAHLFLSMSEHEGFCIPIVEAMKYSVPILAYASSAVPYTLGTGGILFNEKNLPETAEMMHHIIQNKELRADIKKGQSRMLGLYNNEKNLLKLDEILTGL